MPTPKSLRSESRHRTVVLLLLACFAAACGDQKGTTDAAGGDGGTPTGGTNGNAGGRAPTGGAMSTGGAGGLGAAGGASGRAGSSGMRNAGAGGTGAGGRAGAGAAGGAGMAGASAGGGATLAAVQAIFDRHCVTCHDASKQGVPTYPMLALTAGASHDALVNVAADETCGGTRVVPGSPDTSYLVQKLEQAKPCDGEHMPRAFELGLAPPLTTDELATIRAWIQAGAPK